MRITLELSADHLAQLAREVAPLVRAELEALSVEAGSPWLPLAGAAEYLAVSERTLEREIARGRLHSATIGRRRVFHRDALNALAASNGDGPGRKRPSNQPEPPPATRLVGDQATTRRKP